MSHIVSESTELESYEGVTWCPSGSLKDITEDLRLKALTFHFDEPVHVDEFIGALDIAVRRCQGANDQAAQMYAAVTALGAPRTLNNLLTEILSDPTQVQRIADASYEHRNGFDRYVLGSLDGWKLRLHVWWPDHRVAFEVSHLTV